MRTWEDNEVPYAFLITFRTYGTWLHGDERGSVDRFMNKFGAPRIPQRDERKAYNKSIMKRPPVILNAIRRQAVDEAIREVCQHRRWDLHAINVRTNHVHIVVATGDREPERTLNTFKAYSTRKMRAAGCWEMEETPWVDKGSNRWLWNAPSLSNACDYVINGQGADLTDFDNWEPKNPPANAGGPSGGTASR